MRVFGIFSSEVVLDEILTTVDELAARLGQQMALWRRLSRIMTSSRTESNASCLELH